MKTILVMICLFVAGGTAQPPKNYNRMEPLFVVKDSSYTIEFTFAAAIGRERLFEVLHSYGYLVRYIRKTNLTISCVEERPGYNRVSYSYNYLLATLNLVLDRFVRPDSNRISFTMVSCVRTKSIIPLVHHTEGYYELTPSPEGFLIRYYQTTTLNRQINWLYSAIIRQETRLVMKHLDSFIHQLEKESLKQ